MTTLESIAQGAFEKYSQDSGAKKSSWSRLNRQRKLEWMQETLQIVDHLLKDMRPVLNKPLRFNKAYTSLEEGYNRGIAAERLRVAEFVTNLEADLHDDLEQFRGKHVR